MSEGKFILFLMIIFILILTPFNGSFSDEKSELLKLSEVAEKIFLEIHPGPDQHAMIAQSIRDPKKYALYIYTKGEDVLIYALATAEAIQRNDGTKYVNELVFLWSDTGKATAIKGEGIGLIMKTKDGKERIETFAQFAIPYFDVSKVPTEVKDWLKSFQTNNKFEPSKSQPSSPASNDTWKDTHSGLTWQVHPAAEKKNLNEAKAYCENMNLGGNNDWRLPTISDLRSLIRSCPSTQTGGSCGVTDSCLDMLPCGGLSAACQGCEQSKGIGKGGEYWPMEIEGTNDTGDGAYVTASPVTNIKATWGVFSPKGRVGFGPVDIAYNVRCVR